MYQQLGFVKLLFAAGFVSGLVFSLLIWLILKLRKKLTAGRKPATA
jgi:hypothetical protein